MPFSAWVVVVKSTTRLQQCQHHPLHHLSIFSILCGGICDRSVPRQSSRVQPLVVETLETMSSMCRVWNGPTAWVDMNLMSSGAHRDLNPWRHECPEFVTAMEIEEFDDGVFYGEYLDNNQENWSHPINDEDGMIVLGLIFGWFVLCGDATIEDFRSDSNRKPPCDLAKISRAYSEIYAMRQLINDDQRIIWWNQSIGADVIIPSPLCKIIDWVKCNIDQASAQWI